jgi:hypothetical protein
MGSSRAPRRQADVTTNDEQRTIRASYAVTSGWCGTDPRYHIAASITCRAAAANDERRGDRPNSPWPIDDRLDDLDALVQAARAGDPGRGDPADRAATVRAGAGPFVALTYRNLGGDDVWGVAIGGELWGSN